MTIYVGNIAYSMEESQLEDVFSEKGAVSSVKIIKDRETGRSKGFGFVDMEDESIEQEVIDSLDGQEVQGRNLRVNEARQKKF